MMMRAEGGEAGGSPLQAGMSNSPYAVPASEGGPRHVKGPGTGIEDAVEARLSDGEYILPAHVVAAIGDGSNDAGAKALDRLQENVRRHTGKQMAAGKQPKKAGNPVKFLQEKYKP